MSHQQAAVYRARASHLRALADQIETTPSMTLESHAGVDTWHGPRPDECCRALATAQRTARGAVDDLRIQAQRFDETAAQLSAAAFAAERAAQEAAEQAAAAAAAEAASAAEPAPQPEPDGNFF